MLALVLVVFPHNLLLSLFPKSGSVQGLRLNVEGFRGLGLSRCKTLSNNRASLSSDLSGHRDLEKPYLGTFRDTGPQNPMVRV